MKQFKPNGLPLLIGSLPMDNHQEASELVFEYTPEIPLWVQLPHYKEEGMIKQFLNGMPGLTLKDDKFFLDTQKETFEEEYLAFFEEYLSLSEKEADLSSSRFPFNDTEGKGFFQFLKQIDIKKQRHTALKGQITGPITLGTGVKDENGRYIFYNEQLREPMVKALAMKARWQAAELKKRGSTPIIFIDEPVLAGFGTSAYITITRRDVIDCIEEIAKEIHKEDGLAGVHVCANTEWDMLLTADIDIISFDAFSYFDKFILYPDMIKNFIKKGGILAWGIVPTDDANKIKHETPESLTEKLKAQMAVITSIVGLPFNILREQILITPSCGTGSLELDIAKQVLYLTRELSKTVRTL